MSEIQNRRYLLVGTSSDTRLLSDRNAAKVFEGMGIYSPTLGIIGAVLGLMAVMQNLADPSKLGHGIAAAFTATVYGIGLANLFFLPMATKLKVAGVDVATMGVKAPERPDDEVLVISEPKRGVHCSVVIRDDRLVGATLIAAGSAPTAKGERG